MPARAGARYGFRFPDDPRLYPDPASRWQPEGPRDHPRSSDASSFEWHDAAWEGVALPGQVLYEIHVGTFTADGTWRAAEARLPQLRELGVTVIQMMPVAEFAGDFGWGYDGVQWFAPMHTYGTPADLQHFVDAAHQLGLGVILDVVYNHLGPSGNFLPRFSPHYFTERHKNEWGTALNFDDERAHGMRELVLDQRRILDSRFSHRRLPAGRRAADRRQLVRAHRHGHCAGGARRRGVKIGDRRSPNTNRSTRG